jgi:tetraacyldisaccharide 4'-kinase
VDSWLQRIWYGQSWQAWLLLPLSLIFACVSLTRRLAYRIGLLRGVRVGKPVIVIGNITVGGTGKTPLVIWLAQELARRGLRPAVITRGYGGQSITWPVNVTPDSDPRIVGDEAVLIAQRSGAIVIAGPDRVADARAAIALGAEVVVSDDGLQHYRLTRDFEIAVIDGERGFGNNFYLPAGPLRESRKRLDTVGAVLVTIRSATANRCEKLARWRPVNVYSRLRVANSLATHEQRPLGAFAGTVVHAVAGIGNPAAFFAALTEHGMKVAGRALADHAQITSAVLEFGDGAPVLMTEKDAVKCRGLSDTRLWSVPVEVEVENAEQLLAKIEMAARK